MESPAFTSYLSCFSQGIKILLLCEYSMDEIKGGEPLRGGERGLLYSRKQDASSKLRESKL